MLFRRDMEPSCVYCKRGSQANDREVVCVKHGIVPVDHHCRSFLYDPLKRVPPRPAQLRLDNLREEDFTL